MPFRVIQGHRFWYQLKARMRLSVNTNLITFHLSLFPRYSFQYVQNRYIRLPLSFNLRTPPDGGVPLGRSP